MKAQARIFTIPNIITGFRFFLAACLAWLLMEPQTSGIALLAFWVFALASVSDWIDGYLARRWQSITVLGKLMDPLADKVLVATAMIMLIPLQRIPAWLVLLIIVREFVVTGLRGMAASSGTVVAASWLGKVKSTTQYLGLGFLIFPEGVIPFLPVRAIGAVIMYAALVFTLWSGVDYFYKLRRLFVEEA